MSNEPILCEWSEDEVFKPLPRHLKYCQATFAVGERLMIDVQAPRNMAAHRFYFAELKSIWNSLPEDIAEQYPSAEHMRKYALCKVGFCHETKSVFTSHRDAVLAAAFAAASKDYAIVDVEKNVLRCWVPESQSVRAMGADRFKRSCRAVLDYGYGLIGVARQDGEKAV